MKQQNPYEGDPSQVGVRNCNYTVLQLLVVTSALGGISLYPQLSISNDNNESYEIVEHSERESEEIDSVANNLEISSTGKKASPNKTSNVPKKAVCVVLVVPNEGIDGTNSETNNSNDNSSVDDRSDDAVHEDDAGLNCRETA